MHGNFEVPDAFREIVESLKPLSDPDKTDTLKYYLFESMLRERALRERSLECERALDVATDAGATVSQQREAEAREYRRVIQSWEARCRGVESLCCSLLRVIEGALLADAEAGASSPC